MWFSQYGRDTLASAPLWETMMTSNLKSKEQSAWASLTASKGQPPCNTARYPLGQSAGWNYSSHPRPGRPILLPIWTASTQHEVRISKPVPQAQDRPAAPNSRLKVSLSRESHPKSECFTTFPPWLWSAEKLRSAKVRGSSFKMHPESKPFSPPPSATPLFFLFSNSCQIRTTSLLLKTLQPEHSCLM